jgi:hypothetical protein
MTNQKAFISYSWTSPQHAEWVISLATQLRENGVDIIRDKWDLKEGHDAIAFMEKMVTDPEIKKVIVVLDHGYSEKADGRKGGVGTETQIISAEVYKKTDQNKFVAVIAERDAEGRPYLPVYYKSRIYIDLSDADNYATSFDQLLRWIYDKPLHVKPDLGKPPDFLNEHAIFLPTRARSGRAIELIKTNGPAASAALDEYFSTLAEELEKYRIKIEGQEPNFDEDVVANISAFLPYRDELIEVLNTLGRYWPTADAEARLHRFFEKIARYMFRPSSMSSRTDVDFDNFLFLVHEIFLYTIAILIRHERFEAVNSLLSDGYYLGDLADYRSSPVEDFVIFRHHIKSLAIRNQRLQLRRLSLHTDLLEQRSSSSGVSFEELMQADFVLYLRGALYTLRKKRNSGGPRF